MEIKKVLICGGRDFKDYDRLKKICDNLLTPNDIIICGMAQGADLLGKKYADEHGLSIEKYPADWENLGKKAGFIRNIEMLNNCTHVLAFWDSISKGTKHTIDTAKKRNIPLKIVLY